MHKLFWNIKIHPILRSLCNSILYEHLHDLAMASCTGAEWRQHWWIPLHCFLPFILISKHAAVTLGCRIPSYILTTYCSSLKNAIPWAAAVLCSSCTFMMYCHSVRPWLWGLLNSPFYSVGMKCWVQMRSGHLHVMQEQILSAAQ